MIILITGASHTGKTALAQILRKSEWDYIIDLLFNERKKRMSSRRYRVKPGKLQSTIGAVVGVVFVIIGLVMVVPTFGPLGLFWTLIALAITFVNCKNAFSKEGVSSHEIIVEDNEENGDNARYQQKHEKSIGTKLKELNALYEQELITKEEYEQKRREVLNEF